MAIVVSAFTVVVPVRTLEALWTGGLAGYRSAAPNRTFRCDGHLAGVAFMSPPDVQAFVEGALAARGLRYQRVGRAVDVAVVDQLRGPVIPCDWLAYRRLPGWAEAHLAGAPEVALAGPDGWSPDREDVHFSSPAEAAEQLELVALSDGKATFLDHRTGKLSHVGFTSRDGLSQVLSARLDVLQARLLPLQAAGGGVPDVGTPEDGGAGVPAAPHGDGGPRPERRRALQAVAAEAGRMLRAGPGVRNRALQVAGLALGMLGDWAAAIPIWQAFTSREPGLATGWMELTRCCAEAGLRDEALAAARRAVEAAPEEPGAWSSLGAALLALGRRDEALAWISRALAARPDDPLTWRLKRMAEGAPEADGGS